MPATAPLWLTVLLAVMAAVVGPALALIGVLWTQRASDRRAREEADRVDRRAQTEAENRLNEQREAIVAQMKLDNGVEVLHEFRQRRKSIHEMYHANMALRNAGPSSEAHKNGAIMRIIASSEVNRCASYCESVLDALESGRIARCLPEYFAEIDRDCIEALRRLAQAIREEYVKDKTDLDPYIDWEEWLRKTERVRMVPPDRAVPYHQASAPMMGSPSLQDNKNEREGAHRKEES